MDPIEYCRNARQIVAARPELREELKRAKDSGWTREAMQAFLRERGGGDEGSLHSALRMLRQRVLLRTMARDLSGSAVLEEVCATMSALAEVAIAEALAFLEPRLSEGGRSDRPPVQQRQVRMGCGEPPHPLLDPVELVVFGAIQASLRGVRSTG